MYQLSTWQRFWRLEVPHAVPNLVWNMMMSVSGGWFFVVASEAITVSEPDDPAARRRVLHRGRDRRARPRRDRLCRSLCMLIVILLYDQLLFRPLLGMVAQVPRRSSRRTRITPRPWFLIVMQRARLFDLRAALGRAANRADRRRACAGCRAGCRPGERDRAPSPRFERLFDLALLVLAAGGGRVARAVHPAPACRLAEIGWVFLLGPDHRDAGLRADRAGLADLGADRGMDRAASAPRRAGAADRAVPRGVSGQSVLSGRRSC